MSEVLFSSLVEQFGGKEDTQAANTAIRKALRSDLLPKQLGVIKDPSRLKAVLTPRRCGKSWLACSAAIDACLAKPMSIVVIVCLTLKSAKNIYWNNILPRILGKYGLRPAPHHTDMRLTFSNGSIMFFTGAETKAEIEKLRGGSYDLVILDECKSYNPDLLRELIFDVCYPATADRRGTVMTIGTPGSILDGPFYEGTYPGAIDPKGIPYSKTYDNPEDYWQKNPSTRARWSRHSWTQKDNIKLPHLWEDALQFKADQGWDDEHPTWLLEYLGQWVAADNAFVYAYPTVKKNRPELVTWTPDYQSNRVTGLPSGHDWRFLLGLDLGFEDDFALVVGAYSVTDETLYHVYDFKINHQDVYQVAEHMSQVLERFDRKFSAVVADAGGLGKMVIETLNRRHGFQIKAAEKREKNDHIELLNGDFRTGRVKIIPGSDLEKELLSLQWDLTSNSKEKLAHAGKLKEHPHQPNHLCFAPGTLVTTSRGLIPIESVVAGDSVLTHKSRFKKVITPLTRQYEGPMVRVSTPAGEVVCTPEHEFVAAPITRVPGRRLQVDSFGRIAAKDLQGSAVAVGKADAGSECTHRALMFGYWGAEGSKSKASGQVTFTGHKDENRVLPLLETALQEFGLGQRSRTRVTPKPLTISYKDNTRIASFTSSSLLQLLEECGSDETKRLPEEVMSYGPVAALWCFAGYIYGDGHFTKIGNSVIAGSISEVLAKQMAFLARTAGLPCSVHLQERAGRWEGFGPAKDQWILSVPADAFIDKIASYSELTDLFLDKRNYTKDVERKRKAPPRAAGDYQFHTQTTVTDAGDYSGPVYTLSVEDDQTYTVDGLLTQNCDAWLYIWRYSYHYFSRPAPNMQSDSDEWWRARVRDEKYQLAAARDNKIDEYQKMLDNISKNSRSPFDEYI